MQPEEPWSELFEWSRILGQCGMPLFLFVLGWAVGSTVERAHLRQLRRREHELLTIPVSDLKTVPTTVVGQNATMVMGSAVIASDYFKTITAKFRKLIGGNIGSFERLMFRARWEAYCRMLEEAHRHNAVALINVRFETSNIGVMSRNPAPMVEVLAYGTAVLGVRAEP